MKPREMIKLLEKNGWHLDRIRGSHHIMKKGDDIIPVPFHGGTELKKGLEYDILKKAGLK